MKRSLYAPVMALTLVLCGGWSARAADMTPENIQWTYNFSPSVAALSADGKPSAGVTFTNEPTKFAVGSSDVVATNVRTFTTATAAAPDLITGANGSYKLNLTLSSGGATANLSFSGKLTGKFSSENSFLRNTFGADKSQTVTLGNFDFTVEMFAYTPPGPPDQLNAGSISAYVTVKPAGDPNPVETPEPSAMLLSGLGLSFLGGLAWRKRQKQAS